MPLPVFVTRLAAALDRLERLLGLAFEGAHLSDRRTRRDVIAVTSLGAAATCVLWWLSARSDVDLSRFFGAVSPPTTAVIVTAVGVGSLWLIDRSGGAEAPSPLPRHKVLARTLLWLAAFCVVATATDVFLHFPKDLNVTEPWSLILYPSMGLIAEVIFHLAPLATILAVRKVFFPDLGASRAAIAAIGVVALVEPTFQTFAVAAGGLSPLREAITFANLYVFSLVQLDLFRRAGFTAMYGFRLAYYAWWHIVWGTLRLCLPGLSH